MYAFTILQICSVIFLPKILKKEETKQDQTQQQPIVSPIVVPVIETPAPPKIVEQQQQTSLFESVLNDHCTQFCSKYKQLAQAFQEHLTKRATPAAAIPTVTAQQQPTEDEDEELDQEHEQEFVSEAYHVAQELASSLCVLCKAHQSIIPAVTVTSLCDALVEYSKDYAELKPKFEQAKFTTKTFAQGMNDVEAQVATQMKQDQAKYKLMVTGALQCLVELKQALEKTKSDTQVEQALQKIQETLDANKELFESIASNDRLAALKIELNLDNLTHDTYEKDDESIPQTPQFVVEGALIRKKTDKTDAKTILAIPCSAYLLDVVFIVILQKQSDTKKIYRLAGCSVERIDDTTFAFVTITGKQKLFKTKNKQECDKWVSKFEQTLAPKAELPVVEFKPVAISKQTTDVDSPQAYYSTDLDWLYANSHLWKGFEEPDTQETIEFMEGNVIKCATLDKLIQRLTSHLEVDKNNQMLFTFMLTYRNFTTPEGLLEKIKARFNTPPPTKNVTKEEFKKFRTHFLFPIRLRVCQICCITLIV